MATAYELIYKDVFLHPVKIRIRRLPEGLVKTGVRSLTNDQGLIPAGSEAELQQIGNELFRALIPRPQEFSRSLLRRQKQNPGLRTRLWVQLKDPLGDAQPWELLCDPYAGRSRRIFRATADHAHCADAGKTPRR